MSERGRGAVLPALSVLLLAPMCAEYSSGYLESTGKPWELLFGLLFFAPLYGGAALLIRAARLRLGGGWPTRLLLAAAFGLAMTGLIDLSLFTRDRSDVAEWAQITGPTWVDSLGMSVGAGASWTLGHMVLSIAVPLAIVEALAPGRSEIPWMRPGSLAVTAVGFLAIAVFVRGDQQGEYGASPHLWQQGLVAAMVLALIAAGVAWARWGSRRAMPGERPPPHAATLLGIGFIVMLTADLLFLSWAVLVLGVLILSGAAWYLVRAGRSTRWSVRQSATLAVGALASRAALAFTNPPPEGVELLAKLVQNSVFAAVVILLGWLVIRRRPRPVPRN